MASYASHRQGDNSILRSRVEWVDIAKGLGIFLVVFGHTLGGLSASGVLKNSAWSDLAQQYIYIFHMPLFFFLAGMFVVQSVRRGFHDYFLTKVSVIVYPYFLWSLLQGITQHLGSRFANNHVSIVDLIRIPIFPLDQYWFLYVIFIMYMLYWYAHYKKISNNIFLLIAFMLYVIQISGLNIVEWDVFRSLCSFLIYFALGARVADAAFFTHPNLSNGLRLSGLAIIGYVAIAVAVALNVSEMAFLRAVLAVTGTAATIALAMLLSRSSIGSIVRIMGIYSLEIYVSHTIFCAAARVAIQHWFSDSWFLQIVLGTSVGICIPVVLAVLGPKVGLSCLFTWNRSRQNTEMLAIKLPTA